MFVGWVLGVLLSCGQQIRAVAKFISSNVSKQVKA
jgi:hypothetical protein